jgi:aspartyl-tRNA(Asn)/glutamyl-tRNA(Gln) amidotransferase subunit B
VSRADAPKPPRVRHEMVVGLTVGFRLRTATKAFCNCAVDPAADEPNAHTCPVCLGLPGALPVLNARAVEHAAAAALAFGCTVAPVSAFVRRHAFAPALPKGYQITQHERPLAGDGRVQIGETREGAPLTVCVRVVRIEEDAGRAAHDRVPRATALDFNLAGAPLLTVTSDPSLHSAAEAVAFVRAARRLARAVGATDGRFGDGSLTVRARLSVRQLGDTGVGTPCEVVGINSFLALRAALDAEFARQRDVVVAGGTVDGATMLWSADGGLVAARAHTTEADPLCMPEPDLPPLVLTGEWIAEQRRRVPSFPTARREHLARAYGLKGDALDVFTADPDLADYYETAARTHGDPRAAAEWVLGPVLAAVERDRGDLDAFALRVRPADLAELLDLVRDAKLGPTGARHVFDGMVRTGDPAPRVARREGLLPLPDA